VALYVAVILALSSIPHPPPGPEIPHSDKLIHLVEYGVLGLLIARAGSTWAAASHRRRLLNVALLGVLVAVVDEIYQFTTPGRTPSVADALADAVGVTLGGMLWWRLMERRLKRRVERRA